MLKTFTGFRGVAAAVAVDGVQVIIVARDADELGKAYADMLPTADPFDPDRCQKSIVIPANLLPETPTPNDTSH